MADRRGSALSGQSAAAAQSHGVAGDRLVFAPPVPLAQHLARLSLADVFLDTLPYNAHTTASDALWAGRASDHLPRHQLSWPGRGKSVDGDGLPELVTETLTDYEALALRLATNRPALEALKQKLGPKPDELCPVRYSPLLPPYRGGLYRHVQALAGRRNPPRFRRIAYQLKSGLGAHQPFGFP